MVQRILFLHGAGPQPRTGDNPVLEAVRRQWPDADLVAPDLPSPEDPDPDQGRRRSAGPSAPSRTSPG